jgi:hypothetical protein
VFGSLGQGTRTPFEFDVSLHLDYAWRLGSRERLVVLGDVFNLLNLRRTIEYDNWVEQDFGTPNPDFGAPIYNAGGAFPAWPAFQAPLQVRVGAKLEF